MALFRKLFYRKPPDGLLEICERVYVFDCCFTTDAVVDQDYKGYVGGIVTQLKEHYPDASILAFNFREGEIQSRIARALSDYDMTIMEYPRQYEGCPLLPMEVIHHFLRSSESWLSLGVQNLLLMHCERGGWPVLAFMLAALLIYRKHYSGELKTLDMVYRQAPRELLHLLSPLNPMPSQLRYLQYVSRRNVATEWPPLDRALTMDCVIIRTFPNFDGEGGCRPIFRIYGQDPFHVSDRTPKVLFSTPKKSRNIRHYKQAECELVKIDINCHIQGDVVLECICLHGDKEREVMMFRAMFNTAFIRSNILMLNRDEIDILWDAKDLFPKDFRAEVLFSEMDSVASITPVDFSCFEEKDGLPEEAFAKIQEIFSSVDWLVPKGDATAEVLQHLTDEDYSEPEKFHVNQSLGELDDLHYEIGDDGAVISPERTPTAGDLSPHSTTLLAHNLSTAQSNLNDQQSDVAPVVSYSREADPLNFTFPSTPATPPVEDKVGVQSGVSPLRLLTPDILSASTPPLKDATTIRPNTSDEEVTRVEFSQSASPHLTEDVVEATRVATAPPTPPPPPPPPARSPPSLSSSAVDVRQPTSSMYAPSIAPHMSALNVIEATGEGSPHRISSIETDATLKTTPPSSSHIQESPGSTCALTQTTPFPPPTTFTPHLTEVSADKPSLCPPPLKPPLVPSKETSSFNGRPPSPIAPATPTPRASTPLISNLEEHSETGIVSPPPFTPLLKDNSVSRTAPCTPPPPPPPPPPEPPKETSSEPPLTPPLSARPPPCPPPPPPCPPPPPNENSSGEEPLHSGQAAPPSTTRPAPCPPPLPQQPPKDGSSVGGPPLPPPPPHSGQSAPTSCPPPPPPAPANYLGPTTGSPSVPSAPPPPPPSCLPPSDPAAQSKSVPSSSSGGFGTPPPGPPPPSHPPLGIKGKSLLSRTQTSKNQSKKLKPLHWLKLSRAVSGSLWAETQKSGEASRAPEIDISELETLFSAAAPNSDQGGSGRKAGSRGSMSKPEKVQLIDHRRAYNCEIMLSKVKIPLPDMLSSVLALEDSALDVDQVDNLIKFCPTKEEMEVLKGYKGEKDMLGKCEQFFLELMQVPRIEYKLRVFSFKIQFHSQVSDLRNSLNVVNSASEQIRGSAKLKRVMQTILSLGNALNQGTARGSAIGFRLDSLLKLTDTRARNNKITLMHYLCKMLFDKLPELLDFWKDLSSLERASKIQLKFMAEEMQAINKGLEKVMQELSMSESDGPVSDHFSKALKEFLRFSEGEVRTLASLYAGVGRNVDSLILYFGEDPSRCPFEQVISTLLNFVRMFKQAHDENCKQQEVERKKAEKEASEKMKINASDTGHLLQSQVRSVK